jgi:CheY-like chemotaxis protein
VQERFGSPKSSSVGAKILLVEDDADARDAIAELLSEQGFEVLATDEGRKALELMEAWRPALVLLDLHMAGMSGGEFRAQQKRRGRLARIPVVIMTGDPDPAVEGNAVLAKPFTTDDLLGMVARFVPLQGATDLARPPG